MNTILDHIIAHPKSIAILLDPDKVILDQLPGLCAKINKSPASYIFVGGSQVENQITDSLVKGLKSLTSLPIILFPGDVNQLTKKADALLFLSLLSGTNPEYLNGQHIKAAPILRHMNLEVIPTSYVLIDGGNISSTLKISGTSPIEGTAINKIKNTCFAGQYMGKKLTYLEAGSGALHPVPIEVISQVSQGLDHPLIVGGGLRSMEQITQAFQAGAHLVVIGTAFEKDSHFFELNTSSNQVNGNH